MSVTPDGFNPPVPAKILTPDRVEIRIGTLEFADGLPTAATADLLYDHLDFFRGVEAFLIGVPAASLEAMRMGMEEVGIKNCHQVASSTGTWTRTHSSSPGTPTPATGRAPSTSSATDPRSSRFRPLRTAHSERRVVQVHHRPGQARSRSGPGGKYLIVPTGFDGPIPEGYYVSESPSRINWLIARGLLVGGKPDAPTENFHQGLRAIRSQKSTRRRPWSSSR